MNRLLCVNSYISLIPGHEHGECGALEGDALAHRTEVSHRLAGGLVKVGGNLLANKMPQTKLKPPAELNGQ